jgi:hypothetical protein
LPAIHQGRFIKGGSSRAVHQGRFIKGGSSRAVHQGRFIKGGQDAHPTRWDNFLIAIPQL